MVKIKDIIEIAEGIKGGDFYIVHTGQLENLGLPTRTYNPGSTCAIKVASGYHPMYIFDALTRVWAHGYYKGMATKVGDDIYKIDPSDILRFDVI